MQIRGMCLFIAISVAVWAQAPTASVSGTVTDSSGGVLTGAMVTARNLETNVARTASTNQAGNYQILGLQAGTYEIISSQPQFTTVQRNGVVLRVGDEVRIDLTLPTGESRESVVVTESTPLVQLETATAFAV